MNTTTIQPSKIYVYTDDAGEPTARKLRYDNPKRFTWEHRDAAGSWQSGLNGTTRHLFRLVELVASPSERVWIPEGEKDVETLRKLGLVATTSGGSCDPWCPEFNQYLAGRDIIILTDADAAGWQRGDALAAELLPVAKAIRVLSFTGMGLPDHSDVTDWVEAGHTREELEGLANATPIIERQDSPQPATATGTEDLEVSPFQGDQANAERFARDYEGELVYIADRGIRCAWDGRVWRLGDDGAWGRAAIETVRKLYLDAANQPDLASREALARRAIKSEGRTEQMMSLAQVSTKIEKLKFSETFDADPMLLNTPSGIVDLASGKIGRHRADAMITKTTNIPFDGGATCGMFEQFLAHTFDGNQDIIEYVTKLMGYVLSGITKEQAFWFFYGPGATSKSTFVKILRLLLGEFATTLPAHALIIDRNKNQDYGLAELAGVRLATTVEVGPGRRLDSATVKAITGQDHIKACKKYENYFEFKSTAKLVIATNDRPKIAETGDAIWRRVKSVPFLVVIPEKARIDSLEEKLVEAEGPGILALAVRGFQRYLKDGLQEPGEISSAVSEYRQSQDTAAHFVDEHCIKDAEAKTPHSALYTKYAETAKANGEHPMTSDAFARELERLGYHAARTNSARCRIGLRLRLPGDTE